MKKILSVALVLLLVLSLAACGNSTAPAGNSGGTQSGDAAQEVKMPEFLTIGGGSTGGVFFGAASGLAQLFSTKTSVKASAQTTTGGGQNIQLMAQKELDLGIADNLISMQAYNGEESFKDKPNKDIRAICSIYDTYFQQAVRPDSGIDKMQDMKGKTMVVGGPGSGTENATRIVYAAHGIDYVNTKDIKPEWLGVSSGIEKMQNKQADGITSISPPPFSSYVELFMTGDGKLISLDADAITKLTSGNSPYLPATIKAGTYKGQDTDISTVKMKTMVIVRADMSDDVVYELTKMMFENKDYLVQQNKSAFGTISLESAVEGLTIPMHPGAEKYFKEKGVLK
jgi:TRAP transporter TAXI family solute receptor